MKKLQNSRSRLALVLAMPAALLALDLWRSPLLFSKYTPPVPVSLAGLLTHGRTWIGIYRGHQIYASIDDIAQPFYIASLAHQTNGLLISAFVGSGQREPLRTGALLRATVSRLQSLAPEDAIHLVDATSTEGESCAGSVEDVPVHVPRSERAQFAVDRVFVVLLPEGRPDAKVLGMQMRSAISCWQRDGLDSLLVPPLAVRLDDHGRQALSLQEFYQAFFAAIPDTERPDRLYVSFYQAWPTRELEAATSALNAAWRRQVSDRAGNYVVNHQEIRLPLLALLLCLYVCAFYVRYTPRAFATIAATFLGLGFGADKWATPLGADGNALHHFILTAVVLLAMAALFPAIVSWNPKDVLGGQPPP